MSARPTSRLRLIVCDDSLLFREGLTRILEDYGFAVVAQAADGEELLGAVHEVQADVALVDVRMPPKFTDEGLQAALTLGKQVPDLGVLVLSQFVETSATVSLLEHVGAGRGYLLKDRVSDLDEFTDAIRRISDGEAVVDPEVVGSLVGSRRGTDALDTMSARELEILELMAEGRSNAGICELLVLSQRTVESHVGAIFRKLRLAEAPDDHRRVLAVLAYLRA